MTQEELNQALYEAFGTPGVFFRDTELPPQILDKYVEDVFLYEPTFCDATYYLGGFVAPHRFVLVSSHARDLTPFSTHPEWGLCVWPRGRIFKLVAKQALEGKVQLLLLEIPEKLIPFFKSEACRPLEALFVEQAEETLAATVNMEPLPALNTNEWRARVAHPIGIDDRGELFRLPETVLTV